MCETLMLVNYAALGSVIHQEIWSRCGKQIAVGEQLWRGIVKLSSITVLILLIYPAELWLHRELRVVNISKSVAAANVPYSTTQVVAVVHTCVVESIGA